jgi:hypothetical protein
MIQYEINQNMIHIEMWYKSKYDINKNKMLKYDINRSMIKIWYKS